MFTCLILFEFSQTQIMELKQQRHLAQIEHLLYLVGEINYRNGFPHINEGYGKRKTLFKPLFFHTFITILVIKTIISLFITEDIYSVLIGDVSYKLPIRFHVTSTIFNVFKKRNEVIFTLIVILRNCTRSKNNTKIPYYEIF